MKKYNRPLSSRQAEPQNLEHRTVARITPLGSSHDLITELARSGAKQILAAALEQEIREYVESRADMRDEHGHRQIVRNGHCEPRNILTGIGDIEVEQPLGESENNESD